MLVTSIGSSKELPEIRIWFSFDQICYTNKKRTKKRRKNWKLENGKIHWWLMRL